MPLLEIRTNQPLNTSAKNTLMRKASSLVASQLGKPERYVMIAVDSGSAMLFAGNDAPLAYLQLKSISLPEDATTALSAALCHFINDELAIAEDRIYIEFSNAERHLWGWDGHTF